MMILGLHIEMAVLKVKVIACTIIRVNVINAVGTWTVWLDCSGWTGILVLDGAAVVQMLNPGTAKTFQEYANNVFSSYVSSQLATTQRVDLVWDVYIADSLKSSTRKSEAKAREGMLLPPQWFPRLSPGR